MFACLWCLVTKQHAGSDSHLNTLIPLDPVCAVQYGSLSRGICLAQ